MATKARNFRIPDEIYERAKDVATERGTTVSALVVDYLMGLTDGSAQEPTRGQIRVTTIEELQDKRRESKK